MCAFKRRPRSYTCFYSTAWQSGARLAPNKKNIIFVNKHKRNRPPCWPINASLIPVVLSLCDLFLSFRNNCILHTYARGVNELATIILRPHRYRTQFAPVQLYIGKTQLFIQTFPISNFQLEDSYWKSEPFRVNVNSFRLEDVRDALLHVVNLVRQNDDKLERHEFRDRQSGDQVKKSLITIDKRLKSMEPLRGTVMRLDERIADIETILIKKNEREDSQLQKTADTVEDIQRNLPLIIDNIKKDIIAKVLLNYNHCCAQLIMFLKVTFRLCFKNIAFKFWWLLGINLIYTIMKRFN